ncbi:MAG: type II secretion system F family protein [Burkholderiales bacterium]|nr:type II secretion system F family protein [Burkholderiales bacterium]
MHSQQITQFTRQLATLLNSGVALLQALDIVIKGMPSGKAKNKVRTIRRRIETGSALHLALRRHPEFGGVYCDVVAAGEAAGMLEAMLERLSEHREKTEKLHRSVRAALSYPIAVLVIALVVVLLLFTYVVPAFETTFAAFQAELPALTQGVIAVSHFCLRYGGWLFLATVLCAWLGCYLVHTRTGWQRYWHNFVLGIPVAGLLVRQVCIARWCRALATLFATGMPLTEAMGAVKGVTGNYVYAKASELMRSHLIRGRSMAKAMASVEHLFSPWVVQMCAIGEESGTLEHMLSKAAENFESEVESTVAYLSSLIEPLLIIVLGTMIGIMVVALYLPVFELGNIV